MLKSVSVVSVCIACTVGGAGSAFAWDVEHDEIAQLVGESLPAEIKASFDFDDFGVLMAFCHFPDMTEWEPRRWRTVDDYAPHVGPDDRAILAAAGCGGYWAHTEKGKATLMALLARAFGRGDHRVAAFYLSVLTHPVGDESALNHPTILNFVHYCHYQGVAFGTRKVEAGAKNVFGFRSDGDVVRRARAKLKGYRPSTPAVAGFRAQQLALCVRAVDQAAYAAEKEVAIGFGRPGAAEALADLVAMQVRAILDIAWTCWVNRAVDAALPAADFQACFDRDAARATKALDPGRQAVFADLFDASRNPKAPKGTVALVCEALGLRSSGAQSYAGRLVLGACGRTLRDAGYAVKAYDFRNLTAGTLSAAETPTLIVAAGFHAPEAEAARALAAYRDAGGRIVYVSGQDPGGRVRGHGDPFGITGFGAALADRAPEDLPVSPQWHRAGICSDWRKMAVVLDGVRHPLRRDANGDGYAKPACAQEILPGPGIEPLAYLDNGRARFCVAARKGNVTWLPVYLLSPFLFSDDTSLDFGALRLDAFAAPLLLQVVEAASANRPE